MKYLAIDYGNKRTGLATCDPNETIATPLTVLTTSEDLPNKIAQIMETENADAVIIGLPINMDGSEGFQAKRVRQFAEQLERQLNMTIHFQDERLSTFGAQEKLGQTDLSKKKKGSRLDAVAAAQILQDFLEAKNETDTNT
ncbi:MAG: Holliday junction resolvase RuvX [Planctomycetota bacterium]|jgi:putative Holliday junction resolvase